MSVWPPNQNVSAVSELGKMFRSLRLGKIIKICIYKNIRLILKLKKYDLIHVIYSTKSTHNMGMYDINN